MLIRSMLQHKMHCVTVRYSVDLFNVAINILTRNTECEFILLNVFNAPMNQSVKIFVYFLAHCIILKSYLFVNI